MTLPSILLYLALVGRALSATFIHPSSTDTWKTTGPNFISWIFNAGEPSFINLQLLHKNNDTFQLIPHLLSSQGIFASVHINESMMLFTPACAPGSPSLPAGSDYSLRMFFEMTNGTRTNVAVMNWTFNISADNATKCSNNDTFTFPSSSSSVRSGTPSATVSANHSSSLGSHVGAIAGGVVGGLVACLLAIAGIMIYIRHRRDVRKRMTLQFIMKKGLGSGRMVDSKDVELAGRS